MLKLQVLLRFPLQRMANTNSSYFLYGALFSFSFFALILLLLYNMLSFTLSKEFFTQTDNIVVSLGLDDVRVNQVQAKKQEENSEETLENLDDILDSIDSEEIVYSKNSKIKDTLNDQDFLKKLQTRTNIKHDTNTTRADKKTENLSLDYGKFETQEDTKQASGGTKDIYKAQVYKLLYQGWNHSSVSFKEAKVYIRISAAGRMRYEMKQVSGDSEFDSTVQAYLEYLLGTIFPISPTGKSMTFKVKFTTKGK